MVVIPNPIVAASSRQRFRDDAPLTLATFFDQSDVDAVAHLNDGLYGNSKSWIASKTSSSRTCLMSCAHPLA